MSEEDFRDDHLLLDEQAKQILSIIDSVGAMGQDWRNTPNQQAASTRKNLLLETTPPLAMPVSGEACTTKVQFPADYPLVQFFRFAIAIVPVCRSRFRLPP
jgi:hypothetical protein